MQDSEHDTNRPSESGAPANSVESGGSFFLDLAEIQKLIDDRWSEGERTTELVEARETLMVAFKGSLTAVQQPQLRAYFEGRVQKNKLRRLVLDLSNVQYMDSSAIGILAWLKKIVAAENGSLRVLANEPLMELFETLRMVKYLNATQVKTR